MLEIGLELQVFKERWALVKSTLYWGLGMSELMVGASIAIDIGSLSSIGGHDSVCFDLNIADRNDA